MKVVSILTAGSLFIAGAAVAQDVPPPAASEQAPAAEAAEPAPATTPAPDATPAPVTDEEVDNFALAALKVEEISGDAALDDTQKQAAMAAAVQETGLSPQRFNEIAVAIQTDQALNERVQLAAAKHAAPATPEAAAPQDSASADEPATTEEPQAEAQ